VGKISATKVVNAYSMKTAKHPSPLRKWMFFFQPQQHSLSHLILIHMSYHEERCDTHEKEKTISRKRRYSMGGEFSIRMD
ncbi:hypothetical protein V7193_09955, partial [Bacillus velezensis]